jgi:hypothetical protein
MQHNVFIQHNVLWRIIEAWTDEVSFSLRFGCARQSLGKLLMCLRPTRAAWKAAHVGADLGQHHGGSEALDAGNGAQLLKLLGERAQVLLDLRGQRIHRFLQVVELGHCLADQKRVVCAETLGQRFAQHRQLGAQPPQASSASAIGSL